MTSLSGKRVASVLPAFRPPATSFDEGGVMEKDGEREGVAEEREEDISTIRGAFLK